MDIIFAQRVIRLGFAAGIVALLLVAACPPNPTATSTPSSATGTAVYSVSQLKYRLLAAFPDYFWCDPDFYPIARPGSEIGEAAAQFPAIMADQEEFSAILSYLYLDYREKYTSEEQLLVYRQHKRLALALQFSPSGSQYAFVIRTGEGQGWRYEGTIDKAGNITITKKEVSFNTCPICLSRGTMIATPSGDVPVERLSAGMTVWTQDDSGNRMALVLKVSATTVPQPWNMVKITMDDGRTVAASPGHPSSVGRVLGDYRPGDMLDGATVLSVENPLYEYGATYDLLPAGATGCYWADGILLGSTLH